MKYPTTSFTTESLQGRETVVRAEPARAHTYARMHTLARAQTHTRTLLQPLPSWLSPLAPPVSLPQATSSLLVP